MTERLATGVGGLDALLGGGLLPGTLTVVVGASGIGKTQLGVQFAEAGLAQEGHRGVVFDLTARVDPQSHADYARRMCGWELAAFDPAAVAGSRCFAGAPLGEYLHVFEHRGRPVTERELGFDAWCDWQAELAGKLQATIAFFYGHFVRGVRRAVLDGIEPAARPSDSIQLELVEYIYHQILRKDSEWVARDLFREHYRELSAQAAAHAYDGGQIAALVLLTAHESMLEDLISRPLADGDLSATANTLIYLGKVKEGRRLGRALYVAKHRGSAASDEIVPYRIDEAGLQVM